MASLDYYNEIMVDHNNVRDLHKRFNEAYQAKNEKLMNDIANTLVHEAALHSDGEELSIYKVLDKHGLHDAAEKDRAEHQEVKQAMSHVDSNSVSSLGIDDFASAVEKACRLFMQHAEEEENVHYKELSSKLSSGEKADLARDFLKAREMAPSRPHPSAPQDGGIGQKLMGTMAKPIDAMIDHNNFRDLHERFIAAYKDKDAKLMDHIANTLVYEVSVHSDGEELSVYKALDSHGLNSEANEDREIHGRMRRAFAEIDSNSTTSMGIDEFHAAVTDACRLLFSHVEDEEKVHFQKLSSVLTVEERGSLAVDFLRAREMAPGRPHPAAPQTGGVSQKLAGAMVCEQITPQKVSNLTKKTLMPPPKPEWGRPLMGANIRLEWVVPAVISTILITLWAVLTVPGHAKYRPCSQVYVPATSIFRGLLYGMGALLVAIPYEILFNRAVCTPHRLPWFRPMQALRTILTPYERRKPWVLYLTPGLLVARMLILIWIVAVAQVVRAVLLPSLSRGLSDVRDTDDQNRMTKHLKPVKLAVFIVFSMASTAILCPLEVLATRLSVQRNHPSTDADRAIDGESEPMPDYIGEEEDVIALRSEEDPYRSLLDCGKRMVGEEGVGSLFRAWWLTMIAVTLGSFA
ncbi:hypothetical protein FRC07_008520 [Ceratobasidium sp. 392]|nr:hypothetical protein FRC07_008520 [Ceratobasidium sp. 392]